MASGRPKGRNKRAASAKTPPRMITLAGRKIRRILYRTDPPTPLAHYAEQVGLRRIHIYRLINGERWQHIDVNIAVTIAERSNGKIQVADFTADTARPMEDADKDEPRRLGRTGTEN